MKEIDVVESVLMPVEEYDRLIAARVGRKRCETERNAGGRKNKVKPSEVDVDKFGDTHQNQTSGSVKKQNKHRGGVTPRISPKTRILTELREQRNRKIRELIQKTPTFKPKQVIMDNTTVNKSKIERIVDWLLKNQAVITWNRNRELILYGTVIPNTDMVEIFRNLLKPKEKPSTISGAVAVYAALREVGIPVDLLKNEHGLRLMRNRNNGSE